MIDERKLFEALKAEGHDVAYRPSAESAGVPWCCWRTPDGDIPVAISADDDAYTWPFEIYGPDPEAAPIGLANSYDEAVALLAPYRPPQAVAESVAVTIRDGSSEVEVLWPPASVIGTASTVAEVARAFEAIGDGTEVARRLAAGDYDATGIGRVAPRGAHRPLGTPEVPSPVTPQEQQGPALTDGQATVLRTLLEAYAAESGQAPRWRDAVGIAEAEGVPLAELESLRSLFPDDNLSRRDEVH